MGRGADFTLEVGAFRAERYGTTVEVRELRGSYALSLLGKRDRDSLRRMLDLLDREEAGIPEVLVLDERRRA